MTMRERVPGRGATAIEFLLAMPILLLVIAGGLQLGRALVTRHRLSDAVGYAARAAGIARQADPAAVQAAVMQRLGPEAARCSSLSVQSIVVPGGFPGGRAIQVTAVCAPAPLFHGQGWSTLGPSQLVAVAAMPL
jgi:Flp pilus assembly protein TadG